MAKAKAKAKKYNERIFVIDDCIDFFTSLQDVYDDGANNGDTILVYKLEKVGKLEIAISLK